MIFVLPVLEDTQDALRVALRLLPFNAEVVVVGRSQDLPSWLNRQEVQVLESNAALPNNMARGHQIRVHLHAAAMELSANDSQQFVFIPPGAAALKDKPPVILSETRYGARLTSHAYTYAAELERSAFILEREGFVPRLFASGAPLLLDSDLTDITLTRYGYRVHFESFYLRGTDEYIMLKDASMSSGLQLNRDADFHLFNAREATQLCGVLIKSRFESEG